MRKVFIENLPTKKGIGDNLNKNVIDWQNCIGITVNFIYDDINGEIKILEYIKEIRNLKISYLGKQFNILADSIKNSHLARILEISTHEFKLNIGEIITTNNRNLTLTDKKYDNLNWKLYKYTCNICGWNNGWIKEVDILKGKGCSCCSGRTLVEGINDIPTTAPWMIPYFQGGYDEAKLYTKSSGKEIKPICPDCGIIKDKLIRVADIYKNKGIGCVCSDGVSYPEKLMYSVLNQLVSNNTFIWQLTSKDYNWCGKYKYDFYFKVNNNEYIVETDGQWHNNDNKLSGMSKEKSKEIDDSKDLLAEENKIEIIRIDCLKSDFEFIKSNILNSELNNIFDLSMIDWMKCEEYAINNNLIKDACNIKNDNPNLSTTEIGLKLNLNRTTVLNYLKHGNVLGWCEYSAEFERKNKIIKNTPRKIKVICVNTNEIFNKIKDGANKYNVTSSNIGSCCNGKRNSAGKHPITGEKLRWVYYDEWTVENEIKKILLMKGRLDV